MANLNFHTNNFSATIHQALQEQVDNLKQECLKKAVGEFNQRLVEIFARTAFRVEEIVRSDSFEREIQIALRVIESPAPANVKSEEL